MTPPVTPPVTPSSPESLVERRARLLARSAELRERIAQGSQALRPAARMADGAASLASRAREHMRKHGPLLLLAGAALAGAALTRPHLLLGLGLRVWSGWQIYQRVRPLAQGFLRGLAKGRTLR